MYLYVFLWLSPSIRKIERENHKSGGGRIQNRNALSPQFLSAVFDTTSSAMGSNQDSVWLTLTGISPPPSCGPPSLRCLGLGGRIIMALHRSSQCVLPERTAGSFLRSDPAAACRDILKSDFIFPAAAILMAHCRLCFPFPAVQGKVSLLLDMKFSRLSKGIKTPSPISRK